MVRVLIADDDPNTRYLLELFCKGREDMLLEFAENGQQALDRARAGNVDLLVTDVRMPVMSGNELLSAVKAEFPSMPVVLMTSYGSIADAVEYLHRGADDYLAKPLTKDVFLHRLERVAERVELTREVAQLRESVAQSAGANLLGRSPALLAVKRRLPTIAQTEASVVIYGESGTGKEVVARTIHTLSRRADRPFVTVNCGSLPEQLLESELFGHKRGAFTDAHSDTPGLVDTADTGTLFLDEIGEISPAVQVKLLRFLQTKEYKPLGSPKTRIADVRIMAATNRDLKAEVTAGRFREDLFYRLNIVPIELPPLRDREGDVALLGAYFLERFSRRLGREVLIRSPEVYRRLEQHTWPGNVRELENKIEQLVVLATDGIIRPEDLRLDESSAVGAPTRTATPSWRPNADLGEYKAEKKQMLDDFEKAYLTALLDQADGHVTNAAKTAGLDRKNLWQLLKKHGIKAEAFKKAIAN